MAYVIKVEQGATIKKDKFHGIALPAVKSEFSKASPADGLRHDSPGKASNFDENIGGIVHG